MNAPQVKGLAKNIWYLQFEGSEFGPLSIDEVLVIVKSGKLKGNLFAWTAGFSDWKTIDEIPELAPLKMQIQRSSGSPHEDRRKFKRLPLLAMVRYDNGMKTSSGAAVYGGICKDLSEGGIQILGEACVGGEASLIHMTVTPVNVSVIRPFEATGTIRSLLPHGKGFTVEFRDISRETQEQIRMYLSRQNLNP